ncbi:hypothetical protein ACFX2A_038735 [Malus domestica]
MGIMDQLARANLQEKVFSLRHSGRIVDVTHDWAPSSRMTVESSSISKATLQRLFSGKMKMLQTHSSSRKLQLKQKSKVLDRAKMPPLGDSKGEANPIVKSRATRRTRATMVETSKSKPEERPVPTMKKTRAQTFKASKSSTSVAEVDVGRKKQKASRPQATKKPTIASREDPLQAEMCLQAKNLQDFTLEELEVIRKERISPPKTSSSPARMVQTSPPRAKSLKVKVGEPVLVVTLTSQFNLKTKKMLHFVDKDTNLVNISTFPFGKPVVPEIPVVSEVTSPQASQATDPSDVVVASESPISQPHAFGDGSGIIPHSSTSKDGPYPQKEITHPPSPSLVLNSTQGSGEGPGKSPPHLVRKTELSRPPLASRAPPSVEASSLAARSKVVGARPSSPVLAFKINAESSKNGLGGIFQHPSASRPSMMLLENQHSQAERQANRVRCFMEKQSSTSTQIHQLMDEGSAMEDRIKVVSSDIHKLEE